MKRKSSTHFILMLMLLFACLTLCSCGNSSNKSHTTSDSSPGTSVSVPDISNQTTPDNTPAPDVTNDAPSEPESPVTEPSVSEPSDQTASSEDTPVEVPADVASVEMDAAEEDVPKAGASGPGTRGNTQVIRIGSAPGTVTYGNASVIIDASNASEGYIMVNYVGSNPKVKFQLTGTDAVTYTYNLHGGYETFPLTSGSGSYTLGVFENIEGTSYSTLFTQSIDVSISNGFGPYLYANQYVNFSSGSAAVAMAASLAEPANDDLEVVQSVYNYIISNYTYDYDKASSVASGYLPNVDTIFSTQTGICFDYAAVTATMLRTQNIPTRLEVGYMGDVYHAWISVYINGTGWVNGIIQFDGSQWKLMDPTFASTSSSPKRFLTETSKYITKYVY